MSAFVAQCEGAGFPKAIVISGAGTEEANGIYKTAKREYCDAPVYEHLERAAELRITREPHTNPKTGATKHGWLLGLMKQPLYGVPTESPTVPSDGWKKFSGMVPVPSVAVHEHLVDAFFALADTAKATCDEALERQDWQVACNAADSGIEALKRSGERFGDSFKSRAALLLSRRAHANGKLQDHRQSLRDAVAALELVRSLTSAELIALEAAQALGIGGGAGAQKILESVGTGRILDSGAPLTLRCVERWVDELTQSFQLAEKAALEPELPVPTHMESDRYLDGVDERVREEIIKRYMPDAFKLPGGTGIIHSEAECLALMHRWEKVFSGEDFQRRRRELWDRQGLSYPVRLRDTRQLVAESLSDILEPMGFAPGRPGLSRVVKQMQVFWSRDRACASKALDLEELADVSLADLE